jgi:hypothetical protein
MVRERPRVQARSRFEIENHFQLAYEGSVAIDTHPTQSNSASSLSQLALPRSAVRALAACATSAELCPELELRDEAAVGLFAELGGNRGTFSNGELRGAAFRSLVVDQLSEHYFARYPGALGVGIWPLLGTRSHRVDSNCWIDVDAVPIAELRRRFLPQRAGWMQQASCLCNAAWIDSVCGGPSQQRLFVMDESVLPLTAEVMMRVLDAISRGGSVGSEVVLAFDAHAPLRAVQPFQRRSALELVLSSSASGAQELVRYPRLRVVDPQSYAESLRTSVDGINAVARLQRGVGAPAFMHLELV